jgi:hypothetical protein
MLLNQHALPSEQLNMLQRIWGKWSDKFAAPGVAG